MKHEWRYQGKTELSIKKNFVYRTPDFVESFEDIQTLNVYSCTCGFVAMVWSTHILPCPFQALAEIRKFEPD